MIYEIKSNFKIFRWKEIELRKLIEFRKRSYPVLNSNPKTKLLNLAQFDEAQHNKPKFTSSLLFLLHVKEKEKKKKNPSPSLHVKPSIHVNLQKRSSHFVPAAASHRPPTTIGPPPTSPSVR